MPVLTEDPISFKIQDFLAALSAANDNFFFMIEPVGPDSSGRAIIQTWLNIPAIGLSTHDRSKDTPLGFQLTKSKPELSTTDVYVPEALILLNVPASALPKNDGGETWVLQVKDFEKLELFRPIANALADEFKVTIIMTPSQMNDLDPQHRAAQPVNPKFPDGPQFQPIVIKFVK